MQKKNPANFSEFVTNFCINNEDDCSLSTDSNYLSDEDNRNIIKSTKTQLISDINAKKENSLNLSESQKPQKTFEESLKELKNTFAILENKFPDIMKNSNFDCKDFLFEKMKFSNVHNPGKNFLEKTKIVSHSRKEYTDNSNKNIEEVIPVSSIRDKENTSSNPKKDINFKAHKKLNIAHIVINKKQKEVETKHKKENKLLGNKRKLNSNDNTNERICNEINYIYDEIKNLKKEVFTDKGIQDDGNDKIFDNSKGYYEKNKTIIVGGVNYAIIYFLNEKINKVYMCQKQEMLVDEIKIKASLINIKEIIAKRFDKIKKQINNV